MKEILLLVALATTMAMAGRYYEVTQPDGTVYACYQYDSGDVECKVKR